MKENSKEEKTTSVVKMLNIMIGDDPELRHLVEEARANRALARQAYKLRISAGLSQKELADFLGEDMDTIASLEESDFEGNAYLMLNRIALALNKTLETRVVQPARGARKVSPRKTVTQPKVPVKRVRHKVNNSS